jgi:hypothetical protein
MSHSHRARLYPHTRLAQNQELDDIWHFIDGRHEIWDMEEDYGNGLFDV